MRLIRILVFGAAILLSRAGWAQRYAHERVAVFPYVAGFGIAEIGDTWIVAAQGDPSVVGADMYINGVNYTEPLFSGWHVAGPVVILDDGNLVWTAGYFEEGQFRHHLFINDRNYSAGVYGVERLVGPFSVNRNLDIAAQVAINPDRWVPYDVWVNDTNVSLPVLGAGARNSYLARLTDDGRVFWKGTGGSTGQQWDVFVDERNLSVALLGGHRIVNALMVNARGDYAWDGRGDLTNQNRNVFAGQRNFSAEYFNTVNHTAYVRGISVDGKVAWAGGGGGHWDVYRDTTNVTSFLGEGRYVDWDVYMSPHGKVMWTASSEMFEPGVHDVFVERENLSYGILGANRRVCPIGFTTGDQALWVGVGATNPRFDLFVDDFNLSADALGGSDYAAEIAAVGNAHGEILWWAITQNGNEVWLSRPVPEPSALLLALPLAVFLRRRR